MPPPPNQLRLKGKAAQRRAGAWRRRAGKSWEHKDAWGSSFSVAIGGVLGLPAPVRERLLDDNDQMPTRPGGRQRLRLVALPPSPFRPSPQTRPSLLTGALTIRFWNMPLTRSDVHKVVIGSSFLRFCTK
ncbi:hypothetical protein MKZ38_007010 [Zalerion maritima]|uniref:Uncharacterized protein n=1 Tax=Zalerion maritima TaxID=339359 RepID=A0AAD5RIY4_9PEZI|nr:hypothetical protein MKZ38_007010 [Zalerion maritima]